MASRKCIPEMYTKFTPCMSLQDLINLHYRITMTTINFYLDNRTKRELKAIKYKLYHNKQQAMGSLGLKCDKKTWKNLSLSSSFADI